MQAAVVDFHAEASSGKMAFAHSFDGRALLIVGTHTHCPSADHQLLPGGTAFQSDLGMCGDYDSVIGMLKEPATIRFWRKMPGGRFFAGPLPSQDARTSDICSMGGLEPNTDIRRSR